MMCDSEWGNQQTFFYVMQSNDDQAASEHNPFTKRVTFSWPSFPSYDSKWVIQQNPTNPIPGTIVW